MTGEVATFVFFNKNECVFGRVRCVRDRKDQTVYPDAITHSDTRTDRATIGIQDNNAHTWLILTWGWFRGGINAS